MPAASSSAPSRWFEARGLDPETEAAAGGDDYELLATVRPRFRRRFEHAARAAGTPVTRIGVCTADPAIVLRRVRDGATIDDAMADVLNRAFRHFE